MPSESTSGSRRQPRLQDVQRLEKEVSDVKEKLALAVGRVEALEAAIESGLTDSQFADFAMLLAAVSGANLKPSVLLQRTKAIMQDRAALKASL